MQALHRVVKIASLFFLTAVLAACAAQPQRLWLNAPGWSRAELVGVTHTSNSAPMAVDDSGRIYLLLLDERDDVSYPRVLVLDGQTNVVEDHTFNELESRGVHQLYMVPLEEGVLQLLWISEQSLYSAVVEATGAVLSAPRSISGDTRVAHYDVARRDDGKLSIWYSGPRQEPGLYALPAGNTTGPPLLVDAQGIRPDLQYDDAGTLHAAWMQYPPQSGGKPFFYATYPDGEYRPAQETTVVVPRASSTTVLEGPQLGLDAENAYLFWSVTYYSGLEAGTAEAYYVYLPQGQPASVSSTRRLSVPADYNLPYQPAGDSRLRAGARVPLQPDFSGGSTYITEVRPNPTTEDELVIAVRARLAYLMRKEEPQIGAVFFRNGAPTAYQLLSFSPSNSTAPAILSDDAGFLYLTWLENAPDTGFSVYFASTAPETQHAFSGLTADDAGRAVANTAFGLVSGALLLPIALAWIVTPLVVLVLTSRLRSEDEELSNPGTIVSLAIALITYWGGKLITLPSMMEYVPLSAWIPFIPESLYPLLQFGMPILIAIVALAVAWYATYRREEASVFHFIIFYAAIDGVLTMAIYGVVVYAAF